MALENPLIKSKGYHHVHNYFHSYPWHLNALSRLLNPSVYFYLITNFASPCHNKFILVLIFISSPLLVYYPCCDSILLIYHPFNYWFASSHWIIFYFSLIPSTSYCNYVFSFTWFDRLLIVTSPLHNCLLSVPFTLQYHYNCYCCDSLSLVSSPYRDINILISLPRLCYFDCTNFGCLLLVEILL